MTNEQKRIVTECMEIIREAELQVYMADAGSERKLLDHVSRELGRVHKRLSVMLKVEDTPKETRARSLPSLLNEGIL
jgi:hypothetical protein